MGLVYAGIELINYADEVLVEEGYLQSAEVRSIPLDIMADSGAVRLVINESLRRKFGFRIRSTMDTVLAVGTKLTLPVAGPLRVKFRERDCITDAFVFANNEEPVLGAVPMELMDLVIIPSANRLDYNPQHPDGPLFAMK